MIRILWNLSIHLHALLRYAPTNLLLDAIRTPRGLKWGLPAMVLAPVYVFLAGIFYTLVEHGHPDWLLLAGTLMLWNAFKFAWIGPISVTLLIRDATRRRAQQPRQNRHNTAQTVTT